MNKRSLSVWLCEKPVGTLELHSGSMVFTYQNARRPLSMSMPVREEPYSNKACEAFFGALLPDAPATKKVIARIYGINSNSNFRLLEKIGFDCAGAVSLRQPDEHYTEQDVFVLDGNELSEEDLYKCLKELPTRPLFAGVDGIRISLAGAQDKAALCLIDGRLCVPAPNVPTTHILKPPIRGIEHSVENEYFCMSLAKRVGIQAPGVQIRRIREIEFLLVERFDRDITSPAGVRRIHQEDFCQALGILPSKKYQSDGGPSLQQCFELLNHSSFPVLDKRELLKRVVFNFIVGNADCHARNFSILHYDVENIRLAPAYDVLSTVVSSELSTSLAMAIGGESDINRISRQNWHKLCAGAQVNPQAFKSICLDLIQTIEAQVSVVSREISECSFANITVDKISNIIEKRAQALRNTMHQFY